jgi:hypothetical protein
MAYTYSKLASVTVGSGGVSNIAFLNIPQNYTDLLLKFSSRSLGSQNNLYIAPNNSSANMSQTEIFGNLSTIGSTPTSYTWSYAYIPVVQSTWTANTFSSGEVYISNYSSDKYKVFTTDGVQEHNDSNSSLRIVASLWYNVNPITSITINDQNNYGIAQYSTFHLYGIKAEV